MKCQHVVAVLAIPLALSACLTEPEPGLEPPEDQTTAVPERPIARVQPSKLVVEREYRVGSQPAFPLTGQATAAPGMNAAVQNSDALAIAGNGDVHVIGHRSWHHFRSLGGGATTTPIHEPGVFETPFAVAMRNAADTRVNIASHRGRYFHPSMRRYNSVSRVVENVCDIGAQANNAGSWRFTADAAGFWITGRRIVACDLGGQARYLMTMAGQSRHPYTSSVMTGIGTKSLEVTTEGYDSHSQLRWDSGYAEGLTSLEVAGSNTISLGLWSAVEPGATTGYALTADYDAPCTPSVPCTSSGWSIVAVSMTAGVHEDRYEAPLSPGSIIGGMMLIDPANDDLWVLTTHQAPAPDTWVRTTVTEINNANGVLSTGRSYQVDGTVHDAMIVGTDLYISLFTASGARLHVSDLQGNERADVIYGNPGDYPMALKKSFAGVPYFLTREGNDLVVRKLGIDTDVDGLLDRWEEHGIDFNHDGNIDFALHELPGIDPLHKNIVFEVDVANGAIDPRTYWFEVQTALSRVPVSNPDGTTGIQSVLLPHESFDASWMTGTDDEEILLDAQLRGTAADRNSPYAEEIFDALFMATRHLVIFPYRRTAVRADGNTVSLYGRTYGAPGHASSFIAIYEDLGPTGTAYYNILPDSVQRLVRASIVTHEIGHSLGLKHGGHDDRDRKPNYHSVMNGLHILPYGWPVGLHELTFANTPAPTLYEDRLDEEEGLRLDTTHSQHMVRFVTGPPGGPYKLMIENEHGPNVDFDGDGAIDAPLVTADVNMDRTIGALEARLDWEWMDWSLHHSPGWNVRAVVGDAAFDEVEPLLAAGGVCDPFAAQGCTCTIEGQTRPCGTDVGACAAGVQTCTNGFWGLCEGSVPAFAERCDAADDDCDGAADEDFPTLGQACTVGVGACTRSGSQVCSADQLSATCSVVAGDPTTERCSNSVDDDCDGATDEGYPTIGQACSVGLGVCRRDSTFVCGADGVSATCPVTAGTPGAEVCGNGLDDDCDGAPDEDCLPTPISPPTGHLTGSGRVVSAPGLYNPKQVTFRWAATTPGATYEVQADDSATFSSPYVWPPTNATSYTTGDLFTSGAVPFGTRYFWRVRSRVGQGPWSAWTASRYVDVGRLPDDVNGDGYADVMVGATNAAHTTGVAGEGAAFAYHGRSGGIPYGTPARTLDDHLNQANARFGSSFGLADLDADGFTDVVVGIPGRTVGSYGSSGAIAIYFGSSAGVSTTRVDILSPVPETNAGFGAAIAPAGDVDGDGYADVWVAAPDQDAMIYWNGLFTNQPSVGAAYLYRGGPRASFPTAHADSRIGWAPNGRFGAAMRSVGDVDDDGVTDVAFAAAGAGRVFVYRGGSTALLANLTWAGTANFGRDLASGDFDGDGGVDLAITMTSPAGYHIYRKSGATLTTQPWYADVGGPGAYDGFAAAGDIDRDGDADLVLGYPTIGGGRVVLYLCGPSPGIPGHWTEAQAYAELGRSLTLADTSGDGRHDIFAGAPRAYLTPTAPREGKMLGWSMTGSQAFGHAPTVIYDSPRNQAEGWFGQSMR